MPETLSVHVKKLQSNYLNNKKYNTYSDAVCELYGSFPQQTDHISFDVVHDYLVVAGDDGGLTENDQYRLTVLFDNGSKGHSMWGIGARVSGRFLTRKTDKKYFHITDGDHSIRYTYNDEEELEYDSHNLQYTNENGINITHNHLHDPSKNYSVDLFNNYSSTIENYTSRRISKWIVPISDDVKNDMVNIKNDVKKRFSAMLRKKQIRIFFQGEELTVNTPFFETEKIDDCKIICAKGPGDKNTNAHYYLINDKCFDKNGNSISYNLLNLKQESPVVYHFRASFSNPSVDDLEKICFEYGVQKTQYNGILCMKKGVIISTRFKLMKNQRKDGTDPSKHYICCISDDVCKSNNEIFTTNTEKAENPIILDAVLNFLSTYKNIKVKDLLSQSGFEGEGVLPTSNNYKHKNKIPPESLNIASSSMTASTSVCQLVKTTQKYMIPSWIVMNNLKQNAQISQKI